MDPRPARAVVALFLPLVLVLAGAGCSRERDEPAGSNPAEGIPAASPVDPLKIGALEWSSEDIDFPVGDLDVNQDLIVAVGKSFEPYANHITVWDRTTGKERWRRTSGPTRLPRIGGVFHGRVAVGDDADSPVFVETYPDATRGVSGFAALAADDGELLWTWQFADQRTLSLQSIVGVVDGVLVVKADATGACEGNRKALSVGLDAATGKVLWRRPGVCASTVLDGRLLAGRSLLDPATGKTVWTETAGDDVLGLSGQVALTGDPETTQLRLVDISDPQASVAEVPDGTYNWLAGQDGLLVLQRLTPERAVYTWAEGEETLSLTPDLAGDLVQGTVGDRALVPGLTDHPQLFGRDGALLAETDAPGWGFDEAGADHVVVARKGTGDDVDVTFYRVHRLEG